MCLARRPRVLDANRSNSQFNKKTNPSTKKLNLHFSASFKLRNGHLYIQKHLEKLNSAQRTIDCCALSTFAYVLFTHRGEHVPFGNPEKPTL